MPVRIEITSERMEQLTVNDFIALQDWGEGDVDMRVVRDVLARFVVNGDGQEPDYDDALEMVGTLTLAELGEALSVMQQEVENAVVPPANGAPSQQSSSTGKGTRGGSKSSKPRKSGASRRGQSKKATAKS